MASNPIISYCWYGCREIDKKGLLENVKIAKKVYPGWVVRVYVSDDVDNATLSEFTRLGGEVVYMGKPKGRIHGMFWRFLAADSDAAAFISRDLDSRLTERERVAVYHWLASKKSLHIMRDHPQHNSRIMGGMWGLTKQKSGFMKQLVDGWRDYDSHRVDQTFLNSKVWPLFVNDYIAHDSQQFRQYLPSNEFPAAAPAASVSGFIGQQFR